jgi:hypothetical protein
MLGPQRAEVLLQLAHQPPLLQLVHLDDRVQQLEVVAGVPGEQLEEGDVLREARAAEADAGPQVTRPDALIEPHAPRDLLDVRAHELADVCNLVDEADARAQEGVRGQLDHLGGGNVGADDRRVES